MTALLCVMFHIQRVPPLRCQRRSTVHADNESHHCKRVEMVPPNNRSIAAVDAMQGGKV
jgi:hypothetical protein